MKKLLAALAVMVCLSGTAALAQPAYVPIPPLRLEVGPPPPPPPPGPAARYFLVPGHWQWDGRAYVWVGRHWDIRRVGYRWVAGHWAQGPYGWRWVAPHWAR